MRRIGCQAALSNRQLFTERGPTINRHDPGARAISNGDSGRLFK
jgi:hypothetical protein